MVWGCCEEHRETPSSACSFILDSTFHLRLESTAQAWADEPAPPEQDSLATDRTHSNTADRNTLKHRQAYASQHSKQKHIKT